MIPRPYFSLEGLRVWPAKERAEFCRQLAEKAKRSLEEGSLSAAWVDVVRYPYMAALYHAYGNNDAGLRASLMHLSAQCLLWVQQIDDTAASSEEEHDPTQPDKPSYTLANLSDRTDSGAS